MPAARFTARPSVPARRLRRAPAELDRAEALGWGATLEELLAGLNGPGTVAPPAGLTSFTEANRGRGNGWDEYINLGGWWIEQMTTTRTPLREKLVLLLHCQFPTAYDKVGYASLMYRQNVIFRTLGPGPFNVLTKAVSQDPAMLIWLDTGTDEKYDPNENFARELMERFTMGVGTYTEEDVRQSARAFTGWALDWNTGKFRIYEWDHDYGRKHFLGHVGDLSGDDMVEIVTHTPVSARWVTSRLWSWLAYPVTPADPVVAELAPGYATDLNVANLLRAILTHPLFVAPASRQGLVKQPIEWVAGTMRAFGLSTASFRKQGKADYLHYVLSQLGQVPFDPPNVGGWGDNDYWLSTAASLAQLDFALTVSEVADLSEIERPPVALRAEALANLLSIDGWSNETLAALNHVRHVTPELVTLGLVSPEYLAN